MRRHSRDLIRSLERLGFDDVWTNAQGHHCYVHPGDPAQTELSISPSITDEHVARVILRRAQKIAGTAPAVVKRRAGQGQGPCRRRPRAGPATPRRGTRQARRHPRPRPRPCARRRPRGAARTGTRRTRTPHETASAGRPRTPRLRTSPALGRRALTAHGRHTPRGPERWEGRPAREHQPNTDDGTVGWLIVHHSLDGRENAEAP